jgi:hypothetical protein
LCPSLLSAPPAPPSLPCNSGDGVGRQHPRVGAGARQPSSSHAASFLPRWHPPRLSSARPSLLLPDPWECDGGACCRSGMATRWSRWVACGERPLYGVMRLLLRPQLAGVRPCSPAPPWRAAKLLRVGTVVCAGGGRGGGPRQARPLPPHGRPAAPPSRRRRLGGSGRRIELLLGDRHASGGAAVRDSGAVTRHGGGAAAASVSAIKP